MVQEAEGQISKHNRKIVKCKQIGQWFIEKEDYYE